MTLELSEREIRNRLLKDCVQRIMMDKASEFKFRFEEGLYLWSQNVEQETEDSFLLNGPRQGTKRSLKTQLRIQDKV